MRTEAVQTKKRFFKSAIAVFFFMLVIAPWFSTFHSVTQFCTSAFFTSQLPCTESLASFGRLFTEPFMLASFVYVYFGVGALLLAIILAVYCYFRGRIGWGFPLLIASIGIAQAVFGICRLLWRVDINDASHASLVFGTAILDVIYVSVLAILFWLLMKAVIFGFRDDPLHP